MSPGKFEFQVELDTEQPMKALDMLRDRIKENETHLRAFHDAVVSLARQTPWYKRLVTIQAATLAVIAINAALSVYHFMTCHK